MSNAPRFRNRRYTSFCLTEEQRTKLRKLMATRGLFPTAKLLRSCEATLHELAVGGGVTEKCRDRIVATIESLEVTHA